MNTIEICNIALMKLGIPAITSFDENSNSAKLCKVYFPVLKDRVLRDHFWSFARAVETLSRLAETPIEKNYPYVFSVPGDCIRIQKEINSVPYIKVGRTIHAVSPSVTIVYTKRVADAEIFDSAFADALSLLLTAQLGLSNTRNLQQVDYFNKEYERVLARARSIDSAENAQEYQPEPKRSKWLAGRYYRG